MSERHAKPEAGARPKADFGPESALALAMLNTPWSINMWRENTFQKELIPVMKPNVLPSPCRRRWMCSGTLFFLGVFLVQADPVILTQPQSQTAVAGSTATFYVDASGSGPVSYQWWGNLTSLANGGRISGAETSTLTITNLSTNDFGLYYVVVTNGFGCVTSAVAPLSVTNVGQPIPMNPYTGQGSGQYGTLQIVSGSGAFASLSAANKTLSVLPGATLSGAVNLEALNYGVSEDVAPLIYTPSWGEASNSWQLINDWIVTGASAQQAQVSVTAPATPGVYYIIFAFQWEVGGDHLASASNWTLGYDVWNDGNDLAEFSAAQVANAQASGCTVNLWLYPCGVGPEYAPCPSGFLPQYVPADAVTVVVGTPPPPPPRPATATATLVDGFVVAAIVTDGGYGYTNTPLVRFIGGGGNGAQAVAVVSNGVVVGITITDAGIGYTNPPVIVIDPPFIFNPVLSLAPMSFLAFSNLTVGRVYQLQQSVAWYWSNQPVSFTATNALYTQMVAGVAGSGNYRLALSPAPAQAFATAVLDYGFVVHATLTSGGSGYVKSPAVIIVGGGGSNATAVANLSGGVVTNITITDAGIGYTNTPTVEIAQPPAAAVSPTVVPGMRLDSASLAPYDNYQIQFKPDLGRTWGNWNGGLFTPTNVTNSQYVFITNGVGFFRMQHVPRPMPAIARSASSTP